MPIYRCNACGGVYVDPQAGGVRYHHACAPVRNQNLNPDPAAEGYDPREFIEREGHRDENFQALSPSERALLPEGAKQPIKAEGLGRTIVREKSLYD